MFRTSILRFPLKTITWLREEIYRNSPEKRAEAEAAIKAFYQKNKADMERRGVTEAIVKGGKHNDPASPDPNGPHWTVEMVKENGTHITTRHVYPEK